MLTNPTIPLQRLLEGQPVDYPLDNYPEPWGTIFSAMQAAPPFTEDREAAFQRAAATLSKGDLQHLRGCLTGENSFEPRLNSHNPQARLLMAVAELAPVQVGALARHLSRDRANTFRSLQILVSLGLVMRNKQGSRVYYQPMRPSTSAQVQ